MAPTNPEALRASEALQRTHAEFKTIEARRREAVIAASEAGCTLRQISEAVDDDLSYEVIRGIVGPRASVAFEWRGETFQISEPQTRALIYKADGFSRDKFSGDIEKYELGVDWLPAASDLAIAMRRVHVGLDNDPIALDREHGYALCQILRLTYMHGMTSIADLRASLQGEFGRARSTSGRR